MNFRDKKSLSGQYRSNVPNRDSFSDLTRFARHDIFKPSKFFYTILHKIAELIFKQFDNENFRHKIMSDIWPKLRELLRDLISYFKWRHQILKCICNYLWTTKNSQYSSSLCKLWLAYLLFFELIIILVHQIFNISFFTRQELLESRLKAWQDTSMVLKIVKVHRSLKVRISESDQNFEATWWLIILELMLNHTWGLTTVYINHDKVRTRYLWKWF